MFDVIKAKSRLNTTSKLFSLNSAGNRIYAVDQSNVCGNCWLDFPTLDPGFLSVIDRGFSTSQQGIRDRITLWCLVSRYNIQVGFIAHIGDSEASRIVIYWAWQIYCPTLFTHFDWKEDCIGNRLRKFFYSVQKLAVFDVIRESIHLV